MLTLIELKDGPMKGKLRTWNSLTPREAWFGDGTGAIHLYRMTDTGCYYVRSRGGE